MNMEKKGQVAIFIIVGIVIVAAVLVFFLWVRPTYFVDEPGRFGFEGCVENVVEDGIVKLGATAGFVDPEFSYSYDGKEYAYLCYSGDYYETCVVQVPFLKNVFDEGLESLIRDEVDACYDASLNDLRGQGYSVDAGSVDYDVEIEPGVVRVELGAPTSIGDARFTRFETRVNSPVYDMLMIATSIVQFEANYGDSDVSELMLYYPDYYIGKLKRGEGTTAYKLEDKDSGFEFLFASRSLVFPAGYDL